MTTTARGYARRAHDSIGQVRKHGEAVPYWTHTQAVADRVAELGGTPEMVEASELHDVIEDVTPINPAFNIGEIGLFFSMDTARLVIEVTNIFTKEAFPNANRKLRHQWEALRHWGISDGGKVIRLADRENNTSDLSEFPDGFRHLYIKETETLLRYLQVDSTSRWFRASEILRKSILTNINK